MTAGMFAPLTPNTDRLITGYGTPVFWLGLATRLANTCKMTIPTSSATSTCQPAMPSANRLPAVTYPPTLCTSDIQNAKMLYEVQRCARNGARSSLVSRGSYPSATRAPPGAAADGAVPWWAGAAVRGPARSGRGGGVVGPRGGAGGL